MASQSVMEEIASLPHAEREAILSELTEEEAMSLLYDWRGLHARPNQIAPDGDWDIWAIIAGRGFGKTRTGSEWVREKALSMPCRIAIIAETQKDLEQVMVEGDSGIIACCAPGEIISYTKKPVKIRFKNGSEVFGYNATEPAQLRGPQFHFAWLDELAKYRYARETWDMLQFGLRLGDEPQELVTTTPLPIQIIKDILAGKEGRVEVTRGKTSDNKSNLSDKFITKVVDKYKGTRLGRQELDGEILGDMPGALWSLDNIDLYRIRILSASGEGVNLPDFSRIIVSIDPAITSKPESDYHGIIVAGLSEQEAYILEDGSRQGTPKDWATRAIALYDKYDADGIVVEINQGGDMVAHTLRSVRSNIKIIEVCATRGKHVRAEPISALYEQGRIHHVGTFTELETQMTMMTHAGYEGEGSPDRCDALVWALTELFPKIIEKKRKSKSKFKPGIVA